MTFIRRFLYFFYYLKTEDLRLLRKFLDHVSLETNRSKFSIVIDVVFSVFRYNISFKDYFCFRFYEEDSAQRSEWAGTGFMYEYQLRMNPKGARDILENKISFLEFFNDLIKRKYIPVYNKNIDLKDFSDLLSNPSGLLVLKHSHGQTGTQVEILKCTEFTPGSLFDYMDKKKYNLVEEYVIQHPDLKALSPSGLNTVRIITQFYDGQIIILGARLRITLNSAIDNMAAGNIAAPVDPETGLVNGPGVFSDITKEAVTKHPVTGVNIEGFLIPHWNQVLALAESVALRASGNRSVGWDIAVTSDGPELIEGNHNWCKLLWQLPVNQGLKNELLKYL